MRTAPDFLNFIQALTEAPWHYDFYQALRRLECLNPDKPRIGRALRPADEPVRLGQEPSVSFAQSSLAHVAPAKDGRPPRLEVRFFGLLGPNGPMPLHITEYARSRILHAGDPTLARFLDMLQHRYLAMFYRAWADAQPTVSLDRPKHDRFGIWLGSLGGMGTPAVRRRDALPDFAKLHFISLLNRQIRNAEGLGKLLGGFFRVPVAGEQFVGRWYPLPEDQRTRLGGANAALGKTALAGERVWQRNLRVRVHIGPLPRATYHAFLPGGELAAALEKLLSLATGSQFEYEIRPILRAADVQPVQLTSRAQVRLGFDTFVVSRPVTEDRADTVFELHAIH